ncbi:CDP-alcohol phosphatidyltransferase family protein [Arthrobacter psychrolactophilus]
MRRLSTAQKTAGVHAPAYSRFVNRKMGRYLAAWAFRAGLSPDAVTGISATLTYAGIILLVLLPPSTMLGFVICFLLVLGYAFDSADGQVARLEGGGTAAGEWLDHMADAIKISALPLFMVIGFYRFDVVPRMWLLIPLAGAIVGSALFFGMILTEQLRRFNGKAMKSATTQSGDVGWIRSLMVIPMDYGVLCLSFVFLGQIPLFILIYTLITAATACFCVLAAVKWHKDLKTLQQISTEHNQKANHE